MGRGTPISAVRPVRVQPSGAEKKNGVLVQLVAKKSRSATIADEVRIIHHLDGAGEENSRRNPLQNQESKDDQSRRGAER